MVDISASLSLTPSAPGLDLAAILGAETADIHAFGDILAGQIGAEGALADEAPASAASLSTLPLAAGNRQAGGKILPDAAAVSPGLTDLGVEAAAVPAPPAPTSKGAEKGQNPAFPVITVAAAALAHSKALAPLTPEAEVQPASHQPEAAPVPTLLKVLAQVVRPRAKDAGATEAKTETATPTAAPTPDGDADPAIEAAGLVPISPVVLPLIGSIVPPAPVAPAGEGEAMPGAAAPLLPQPAAEVAKAAAGSQASASPAPASPVPAAAVAAPMPSGQSAARSAVQAAAQTPSALLTVAGKPAEVSAPLVTILPAAPLPLGPAAVSARIKVSAPPATNSPAAAAPAAAVPAADRAAPLARTVAAERAPIGETTANPATPESTDLQAPVFTSAPATAAAQAPVAATPGVALPRHDFAALVDRLIEARNASVTPSSIQAVTASVHHAEFGQVSLQFQQDGKDLSVSMSSADPDFAAAVQAAMPVDRPATNSDSQQRGQTQGQSQMQSQNSPAASSAHHEATGQRGADAGQTGQGREGHQQGRNSRSATNTSNPATPWPERDPGQARGGIFA